MPKFLAPLMCLRLNEIILTSLEKKFYAKVSSPSYVSETTVKILNIGTCMSEQTVKILIRLRLRSSLIRIFTVCYSFYIYWRHNFIVKLNCFILRTTTVAGLGVPIFRVFTVNETSIAFTKSWVYA